MKAKLKSFVRPAVFVVIGALVGYFYYYFFGCVNGTCAITSNPVTSMIYMGFVGWLLSGVFSRECDTKCNM